MISRLIGERGRTVLSIARDSKTKINIPPNIHNSQDKNVVVEITGLATNTQFHYVVGPFVKNHWFMEGKSMTPSVNLDCVFEKNYYFTIILIVKSQQNRIELVTKPGK